MPCRVGITTDPSKRKGEWERQVVGMKNWKEDFMGWKSTAQSEENRRYMFCNTTLRGECHAHPGGGDPDEYGWYVYEFDYI